MKEELQKLKEKILRNQKNLNKFKINNTFLLFFLNFKQKKIFCLIKKKTLEGLL